MGFDGQVNGRFFCKYETRMYTIKVCKLKLWEELKFLNILFSLTI